MHTQTTLELDSVPNVFYNTPSLSGKELIKAERKAATKNARILQLFIDNPLGKYTPIEVSEILNIHESSCRRACHQLAKEDNAKLIRLAEQKIEKYGLPNHYYQLRNH